MSTFLALCGITAVCYILRYIFKPSYGRVGRGCIGRALEEALAEEEKRAQAKTTQSSAAESAKKTEKPEA